MKTIVLAPGSLASAQSVSVPPAESKHLRARRARDGETVRVTDGQGAVGQGTLAVHGRSMVVHLAAMGQAPRPAPLLLAVGAGDRSRFRWIVEKASELAVTEIIPLMTARSQAVATRVRPEHIPRLEGQAREAIKQSGATWAPVVRPPVGISDFLASCPEGVRWLADPAGHPPARIEPGAAVVVAVGPEGGFTGEEQAEFLGAGFDRISLGSALQRFETAALAAAVVVGVHREWGHDD